MLRIYYGELEDNRFVFNPDVFFNNTYRDEWLISDLSKQMILDVDGSNVIGAHLIDSPFLGPIAPERLSGGVKTLILAANDEQHIFNASACGDNCAKWLLKIGEKKDLLVRLGYMMDFGEEEFCIKVENTGRVVNTQADLTDEIVAHQLL